MEEPTPKRHRTHAPHKGLRAPQPPVDTAARDAELLASNNPLMPMFLRFREELDEHHDRRERVIKASRDVTALSKKVIFTLQRYVPSPSVGSQPLCARTTDPALSSARKLAAPLPANLEKEASLRLSEIQAALASIAPDLLGINANRYQRNISGGLQELIEALAFYQYLTTGALLPYSTASTSAVLGGIELTVSDYVLGIFDFVGEAMRFGITMVALSGGGGGDAEKILSDMRRLREEFEGIDTLHHGGGSFIGKDVDRKMTVMKQCVEKVENAVYSVIVRGSEKPKGWVPEMESLMVSVGVCDE